MLSMMLSTSVGLLVFFSENIFNFLWTWNPKYSNFTHLILAIAQKVYVMYKYRNLFIYKVGSKKSCICTAQNNSIVDLFYCYIFTKKKNNMTVAVSQLMFSMFLNTLHFQTYILYFMMCFSVCPFSQKLAVLIFDSFELSCFRY